MAPKAELLRLAAADRRESSGASEPPLVRIDAMATMPGRGAYLCRGDRHDVPRRECLSIALSRKAFPRAFRRPVEVPAELVESVGP